MESVANDCFCFKNVKLAGILQDKHLILLCSLAPNLELSFANRLRRYVNEEPNKQLLELFLGYWFWLCCFGVIIFAYTFLELVHLRVFFVDSGTHCD